MSVTAKDIDENLAGTDVYCIANTKPAVCRNDGPKNNGTMEKVICIGEKT